LKNYKEYQRKNKCREVSIDEGKGGSEIVEKNRSRKVNKKGVLNIQPFVVRSLPHSSSSLECAEGKMYNENM
jgi:hypothetical protein